MRGHRAERRAVAVVALLALIGAAPVTPTAAAQPEPSEPASSAPPSGADESSELGEPNDAPAPSPAPPSPPSANAERVDALLTQARRLRAEERYPEARALLDEAYRLDPRPSLLWARAQAARWAGDCPAAIVLYEQYMVAETPLAERHRARANVERCRADLIEAGLPIRADPPAPAPSPDPTPPPTAPPEPTDPSPPPSDRVRPGVVPLATGSVLLAAGIGLLTAGAVTSARADRAPTEDAFGRRLTAMRVEVGLGTALAGIGVGLAAWGVVRLMQHRRSSRALARRRAPASRSALTPAQHGAAGSY